MSAKDSIIKTINHNIDRLEKRLNGFFQIPHTSEYFVDRQKEDLDIRQKIEEFEVMASIYSVLEADGVTYSATSKEYGEYLDNLRKIIEILKSEKAEIERKNTKEIENINLLLKELYKKKNEINQ